MIIFYLISFIILTSNILKRKDIYNDYYYDLNNAKIINFQILISKSYCIFV